MSDRSTTQKPRKFEIVGGRYDGLQLVVSCPNDAGSLTFGTQFLEAHVNGELIMDPAIPSTMTFYVDGNKLLQS